MLRPLHLGVSQKQTIVWTVLSIPHPFSGRIAGSVTVRHPRIISGIGSNLFRYADGKTVKDRDQF